MSRHLADIMADLAEHQAETRRRKAAYMRGYRKTHRLTPIEEFKQRARQAAHRAKASGLIVAAPCSSCGAADAEMHHEDYERPLDVVFLCHDCHRDHHHALRIGA